MPPGLENEVMNLSSVNRALWSSLPLLACLPLLSFLPQSQVHAANAAAAILPSAGKPLVRLRNPQTLKLEYVGSTDAVAALESGRTTPTALAEADFNADGAPDVVAGYATEGGGVLTVLLGNRDAYAPKDPLLIQKAMHGDVAATFLPSASAVAIPESPDLIVTGDFNRDGRQDVLVAARGGNLYLLAGDGKGNLGSPRMISTAGLVWAMAATGDGHVAVSTEGGQGPEVRILAPSQAGLTVSAKFPLPVQGDTVVWGPLGGGNDLAVGVGSRIAIIYNPLKANPETETVDLPFAVKGLTLGDFVWDREGRTEMAALAGDGTIHILEHGTLDTRPLTAADLPGRRAAVMARARQHIDPASLGAWTDAKKLAYAGPAPSGPVGPSAFSSPRLAAAGTSDLMVLDGQRGVVNILDTSGKAASPRAGVSLGGTPVAALTLPQTIDAGRDTVILASGGTGPIIVEDDSSDPMFNVTTTADTDVVGACGASSGITSGGSPLSLRTAICEIDNSGTGTYTINLPAGTYSLTLNSFAGGNSSSASQELQLGFTNGQTITIAGAGASTTIIQQTDSQSRILEVDPGLIGGLPLTISNVTLQNGKCTTGLDCSYGGAALVAGAATGDALTLTNDTLINNVAADPTDGGNYGGAVEFGGPALTVTGSTFSSNSTATGSGGAGGQGGAIYFDSSDGYPGNLSITNSTFTGNIANSVNGGIDTYGGAAFVTPESGNNGSITGSTFTGNIAGGTGDGGAIYITGPLTASNSRFVGNTATAGGAILEFNDGDATVTNNWWGCNTGPNTTGCDVVTAENTGTATFNPWLVLGISANPTSIEIDGTSTLTAGITTNSNGTGGFSVPNGTAITFGGTLGTANPTGTTLTSGQATSTFTAGGTAGVGSGTAKVDNQTVSATIDVDEPPSITSASSTTFTEGSAGSFAVNTTGFPTPAISESGALPNGVTFTDNGNGTATLAGTATAYGTYPITITANNGISPPAQQSFTLTVSPLQYQLTTAASPSAGGTVTPATGGLYNAGTIVPITAIPNSGYAFVSWSSSPGTVASPTSASTTITMNAAESVTANFGVNLVVTTATDDNPGVAANCTAQTTPGSNTTDTACSLRDALTFAASSGATSITFASAPGQLFSSAQTITLLVGAGTLSIPSNTTIAGPTTGAGATVTNLVTVNGGGAAVGTPVFTGSATAGGSSLLNLIITNGIAYGTVGAGIFNTAASTLTITNCTITGNDAPQASGGIYNDNATMTVINSTISGNSGAAGGLSSGTNGSLTVIGTTITGNTGTAVGGGLYVFGAPASVTNSTISGNTSDAAGGGSYSNGGTINLANTIVAGNTAPTNADVNGGFTDKGGNQISTAVNLSALGSYGGPTQTMISSPVSTAICSGTTANATAAGITTDQRGFVLDPNCPMGSVDAGAVQTNYMMGFNNVPHTTVSGQVISPAPIVTLYESGAISTASTAPVTLSDASSALSGATTQNFSAGTATFPGISFTSIGLNTQLIATLALSPTVNLVATAGTTTTVSPLPAVLTSPANLSTLTGPAVAFSWSPVTGASAYSLWVGTTGAGSRDLYSSGAQTATSLKVANLPTTGGTVYVRLNTIYNGVANSNDYTFTATTRAAITSPASPGTLSGLNVTFNWSPSTGAVAYSLWLGSTGVGSSDLYHSGATTAISVTASGLPTNGETVYARLSTIYANGVSVSNDSTYTAANIALGMLSSPTPSTTLSGATVAFSWSAGTGATAYSLWLGSAGPGSNNLYQSHATTALTATATGLPTNGTTIYARLYTIYNGGVSKYIDYTYNAAP